MVSTPHLLVISTYPNHTVAEKAAIRFLELGLVACTNIMPLSTSIFMWNRQITQAGEVLVLMKTRKEKLVDLEKELTESHPYDVAEFIALPIEYGSAQYLQWIDSIVK